MNNHRRFFNRLPLELWLQILYLIPARSLVVLRTTCKSFLRIINDPEFVCSHLQHFPDNLNETRFLTIQRHSYQVRQIITSRKTLITTINEQTDLPPYKKWHLKGSLDGLLLFQDNETVHLWNPSIKKHRQLSLPTVEVFGLGYDNSCHDYKVVAMYDLDDQAWVYSVKTGSWVEILNSGIVCKPGSYSKSLSFKNGVFWVGHGFSRPRCYRGVEDRFSHQLVWFDFGTERFRYSKMPYSINQTDPRSCSGLMMLDGGSSVGVCGFNAGRTSGSVWALETDTMSWTRRYKIVRDALPWLGIVDRVRLVERNGELVMKHWVCERASLKSLSYNIKTEGIECVKFKGRVNKCYDVYIESLVML